MLSGLCCNCYNLTAWQASKWICGSRHTNKAITNACALLFGQLRRFECEPMPVSAAVNVFADGTVLVAHGGIEMGQGLSTKVKQAAVYQVGRCQNICFCEKKKK
jgi:hypothetical protein